jgi:hypothetical protein
MKIEANTKLAAVVEEFPQVESLLKQWIPVTEKGPQVWRSLSKAANMGQIAATVGVTLPELVRRLREAGIEDLTTEEVTVSAPLAAPVPEWATAANVRFEFDVESAVAGGEHPLGKTRSYLEKLEPGEAVRLTSSFYPAALIDVLRRDGIQTHTVEVGPHRFETYVAKPD